jgi:3-oxoacyl-[acyl-carrier-protein] synthase-1
MAGLLHVTAFGASTPVGRDAWSSAAAVRAGICGFVEHPFMIDSAGQPMRLAVAPWLDLECQGPDRFEALLVPAIEQALAPLDAANGRVRTALALACAPPRPGRPDDLESSLAAAVVRRFPNRFAAVATSAIGHAGGLLGVEAAWRKIDEGAFDACVIAGVESHAAPETLEWLEQTERLHGAGSLNNAWGFVPGEAAGAVLLVGDAALHRLGLESLSSILSLGTGFEQNRIRTQTVCIGEGLTAAFRAGLAGLPAGRLVTDIVCDMNGEPYRADEFGFAALRTGEHFVSASDFVTPADCWGDVSAAFVPLALALSTIAGRKTYANGPLALVWASSDSGERAAALVDTVPARRGH